MSAAGLCLAYSGLALPWIGRWEESLGSLEGVVEGIKTGDIAVEPKVREQVLVDPAARKDELKAAGIAFIESKDAKFPSFLAGIPDAPRWLFIKGSLPTRPSVAIVGSRRATSYGLDVAKALARECAQLDVGVISGLAAGVDGAAHEESIKAGGLTWAVLGCGIDVWYPRRHQALGESIIATGGGVISEYPPGTRPEPWRFPARNRIIAAVALVVVVVEAAARSGALITARVGAEIGREVLAVPGDIDRPTSAGCNQLIRDGAHPLDRIEALGELLGFISPVQPPEWTERSKARSLEDLAAGLGVPVPMALARIAAMEQNGELTRLDDGRFVVTV